MPNDRSPSAQPPAALAVAAARTRLDEHVREIVDWHFDPKSGCPFWLAFAGRLGFDPRKEVRTYDDLDKFPPFQDEWLRGGPVRRWVPRGYEGRGITTFETGGTTGVPKSRINIDDYKIDYELFSTTLDDRYFPKGGDWLMLGPSGPRRLRLAIEHLAQHRGGIAFGVDLDPRWVTKLIKSGRQEAMHEYKEHVVNQGLTILRAHPNVRCLFTTPKLLEALCDRVSLVKAGVTGVFCGGTSMTAQFYRFATEELLEGGPEWWKNDAPADNSANQFGHVAADPAPLDASPSQGRVGRSPRQTPPDAPHLATQSGDPLLPVSNPKSQVQSPKSGRKIDFVPTYGNTLMGLATHKPFDPADNYSVIYHPPLPRALIEVVDPRSTEDADTWHVPGRQRHRIVAYGEVGRVRLTTLTREFFMPRFLERDEAVRHPPCEKYPWDGAGDVRPFSGFATPLVEGVY